MPHFQHLKIYKWRQFSKVDLPLENQTTIITGTNGSGKTTLLRVLGNRLGWTLNFVSTPYFSKSSKTKRYSDFGKNSKDKDEEIPFAAMPVGSIRYSDGSISQLITPAGQSQNPQYKLTYQGGLNGVPGIYIPSHRPALNYHPLQTIPTNPVPATQHAAKFQSYLLQSYTSTQTQNPGLVLKESIVSLALFGLGNDHVVANQSYAEYFCELQRILAVMLPPSIGFRRIEIRMPDVVLETESGDFSLDSMSGGIASILLTAWQILISSNADTPCTVVMDEPENHLHPEMQRNLLPNLATAFPNHRFIVASHSPFIITSDPDATVIGLRHNAAGGVESSMIGHEELAASPESVFQDVLGLDSVSPVWVENKFREIMREYEHLTDGAEKAKKIFEAMKVAGISDLSLNQYESE